MKWKNYELDWCEICDTAIIVCPECGATSCNATCCESCMDDMIEFNKHKTVVSDYLTEEEIVAYWKCRRLKKLIMKSLEKDEMRINWNKLLEEGELSDYDCKLFEKELKGKRYE